MKYTVGLYEHQQRIELLHAPNHTIILSSQLQTVRVVTEDLQ